MMHHAELAKVYLAMGKADLAAQEWQNVLGIRPVDLQDQNYQKEARSVLDDRRNSRGNGLRGYWHTRADSHQPMEGPGGTRSTEMDWYKADLKLTLPLPGGGRATGAGVLHAGDTTIPDERWLLFDGASYWVWHAEGERETGPAKRRRFGQRRC